MGGSNPNDQITAIHFNPNEGIGSHINDATVNKPWSVESSHPELVSEGMIKGIGPLAKAGLGAAGSAIGSANAYHGQFGSDQMSSQGFFESEDAARKAGIANPQQWTEGTGRYGNENTGWY
jgi:hypothetical protein